MPKPEFRDRPVRSFVIRQGRMTGSQKRALAQHWANYGLSIESGPIDPEQLFGRTAPLIMEIGYGMGSSLAAMAESEPDHDFIGVEVHPPGVNPIAALLDDALAPTPRKVEGVDALIGRIATTNGAVLTYCTDTTHPDGAVEPSVVEQVLEGRALLFRVERYRDSTALCNPE